VQVSGQNYVCIAAGLGKEDILHNKEGQLFKRARNMVCIRVGGDHVLAREIDGAKLSVVDRIHHLVVIHAAIR